MLGSVRVAAQERPQVDRGKATTRGRIRLMNDEGAAIRRLAREEPSVPICTPIQFSSLWDLRVLSVSIAGGPGTRERKSPAAAAAVALASDAAAIAAILFSCKGVIAA